MFGNIDVKKIYPSNKKNKKLKKQYRNYYINKSFSTYLDEIYEYEVYTDVRSQSHKRFSKKQEKSLYVMHELEYRREYNLKMRRKRSARNLAEPWDDYPSYVLDAVKSWKHSTKRKKQYYNE